MTRIRHYEQWDEDDVRVRPSARNTRPRTKDRPQYDDAQTAMVVAVDRGRITCWLLNTERPQIATDQEPAENAANLVGVVTAVKARRLGRRAVVVGDHVHLVGDLSGNPGTLARLVRILPREHTLRRTADDTDPVERIVVANADQLGIVISATEPEPQPRMVDRALVAAKAADMQPLLIVTKCDLADPAEFLALYVGLDVPMVTMSPTADRTALLEQLHGHTTVLLGSSGVGKSTLVNYLIPGVQRATGGVNEHTGRGRHTSTSALALPLPDDAGWIIDTPGVRSFGLAHVSAAEVLQGFPDLTQALEACPRGCLHQPGMDCELDTVLAQHEPDEPIANRIHSVRRLLASLEQELGGRSDPDYQATPAL